MPDMSEMPEMGEIPDMGEVPEMGGGKERRAKPLEMCIRDRPCTALS